MSSAVPITAVDRSSGKYYVHKISPGCKNNIYLYKSDDLARARSGNGYLRADINS